jgi:spore germination protein GerM
MIPRSLSIGVAIMLAVVFSMGIYVGRMRRRASAVQPAAADTRPVAPPRSGPTESVTLYVADDTSGNLHPQAAQIPVPSSRQQRAEELLRALLQTYQQANSSHPIAPSAELRGVYLPDPGIVVIDMNAAFADQHRSGILNEQLTVNSIVDTLANNVPGISRVRILIDGRTRETLAGHADLADMIDVGAVQQPQ